MKSNKMGQKRYHEIALKMAKDYHKILHLIEENNGKIPSKKLKELYEIDSSAAREIFIGMWAIKEISK